MILSRLIFSVSLAAILLASLPSLGLDRCRYSIISARYCTQSEWIEMAESRGHPETIARMLVSQSGGVEIDEGSREILADLMALSVETAPVGARMSGYDEAMEIYQSLPSTLRRDQKVALLSNQSSQGSGSSLGGMTPKISGESREGSGQTSDDQYQMDILRDQARGEIEGYQDESRRYLQYGRTQTHEEELDDLWQTLDTGSGSSREDW